MGTICCSRIVQGLRNGTLRSTVRCFFDLVTVSAKRRFIIDNMLTNSTFYLSICFPLGCLWIMGVLASVPRGGKPRQNYFIVISVGIFLLVLIVIGCFFKLCSTLKLTLVSVLFFHTSFFQKSRSFLNRKYNKTISSSFAGGHVFGYFKSKSHCGKASTITSSVKFKLSEFFLTSAFHLH